MIIKPRKEYVVFNVSEAWFPSRVPEGAVIGGLSLGEKFLTVTFRFKSNSRSGDASPDMVAWDSNERRLDGFNPTIDWIRGDLSQLFQVHRVHEFKRRRPQSLVSRKPSIRSVLAEYSRRERNRVEDFVNKATTLLCRGFSGYIHSSEDLANVGMFTRSRSHNRRVAKSYWRKIVALMRYKAEVWLLDPHNASKRCSRCG